MNDSRHQPLGNNASQWTELNHLTRTSYYILYLKGFFFLPLNYILNLINWSYIFIQTVEQPNIETF